MWAFTVAIRGKADMPHRRGRVRRPPFTERDTVLSLVGAALCPKGQYPRHGRVQYSNPTPLNGVSSEANMQSIVAPSGINRRVLLSPLAVLPIFQPWAA